MSIINIQIAKGRSVEQKLQFVEAVIKATSEDLPEILHLQKLAFSEVALLMDNFDLPPLQQTLEDLCKEYENNDIFQLMGRWSVLSGGM